jgi:predicted O-methyltransferase YrrM
VFDLYENCISKKSENISFDKIENQRQILLKDRSTIHIQDFGTGCNRNSCVADVVKQSSKPSKQAQLLYQLALHFSPETIIELGTAAGISTMYMAAAYPEKKVITIEGSPEIGAIAENNFKTLSFENIDLIIDTFDNAFPALNKKIINPALIFIDEQSVMVFDDIYWSKGMMEAWNEIKKHPDVTVSIDLFTFGIVFFKSGLTKQDFILRF